MASVTVMTPTMWRSILRLPLQEPSLLDMCRIDRLMDAPECLHTEADLLAVGESLEIALRWIAQERGRMVRLPGWGSCPRDQVLGLMLGLHAQVLESI